MVNFLRTLDYEYGLGYLNITDHIASLVKGVVKNQVSLYCWAIYVLLNNFSTAHFTEKLRISE